MEEFLNDILNQRRSIPMYSLGEIPHLGKEIPKVPGSKGVNMEEFLDDILNRRGNISIHTPGS